MRGVLGFDGGGSKTDCVLMSESGAVVSRGTGGPSNPSRIGFANALTGIRAAAEQAIGAAVIDRTQIAAVCAGLAGTAQPADAEKMRALLAADFPRAAIRVCTDFDLILATAPAGPAIVLIAGTGSAVMGRNAQGETARVGGHGPMISDEGSAYDVGRRAVMAALREYDRTAKNSPLGQRILAEMGSPQWPELRKRIQSAPDEVFPRLFSVAAVLADSGDQTAQGILRTAAYKLAEMAVTLAERLHLHEDPFPLIQTGGMIGRSKYFDAQLQERLRVTLPNATPTAPLVPPAEAAARLALVLLPSTSPGGRQV